MSNEFLEKMVKNEYSVESKNDITEYTKENTEDNNDEYTKEDNNEENDEENNEENNDEDTKEDNTEENDEDTKEENNDEDTKEENTEENDEDTKEENTDEDNNEENIEDKKKKKKRHYFSHHIRKILKEICPDRDITQKAKDILNEVMIITCKMITNKALFITKANNRKTLTETELESSIKLLFLGQLSQRCVEEGYKCLKNYVDSINGKKLKGRSRNEKADILVPPSLLEKFLKNQGIYVSSNSPIFLAGIIEYFVSQILDLANNTSVNNKNNVRLTIYDIENGISMDKELLSFFISNNIYLHGSGIVPYIHPDLKSDVSESSIKSLKIIEKVQENTGYIFPKTCIDNKFRNNVELIYPEARYQKDCFNYFQDYLEKWIVEILQYSNNITLYSKKSRVSSTDIELALSILERRQPSFLENILNSLNTEDHIKFEENEEEN